MANPEHLNILKQGVKAWNTWREKNRSVFPNLSKTNLTGAILTGADLTGAILTEAYLGGGDLRGADLGKANLTKAYLRGADLGKANLTKANLFKTNLTGATNLTQAQLNQAYVDEHTKLPEGLTRPKPCSKEELPKK